MISRTGSSERTKGELAEGPSTANQASKGIGLLAVGLSIVLGLIVGFLTHEFVVGLVFAVVAFAVVVFGAGSRRRTISEKCSPREAQVPGETLQQESNLTGDAAKTAEHQTAPEVFAVRTEPEEPEAEPAKCEENTGLSMEESTLIRIGYPNLCGRCGQPLRDGVKFCEKCGVRVGEHTTESAPSTAKERLCGNCGCSLTVNSKACKWCGAALK